MFNPHQELLEQFQTLTSKIERLELLIQTQNSSPKPTPEEDILFTPKQLAEYWQCSVQTIHKKKRSGEISIYEQNGRIIRFSKRYIDKMSKVK